MCSGGTWRARAGDPVTIRLTSGPGADLQKGYTVRGAEGNISAWMGSELLLIMVVVVALAFDFTNGFHDTANAMATSIATGALKPRVAVAISAVGNLAGAFISIKVAATIATGIVDTKALTLTLVFAALIGAIAWNLITWALSLPSSSSHALIGGVIGATLAGIGSGAVKGHAIITKVLVPALFSPLIAGLVAIAGTFAAYKLVAALRAGEARRGYRLGQIGSASLVSLAHGTNDAQKTMGVITLALIAHGDLSAHHFSVPMWVKLSCGLAIALGTYIGGWPIINTMGNRLTEIESPQGFAAESAGASVILASAAMCCREGSGRRGGLAWLDAASWLVKHAERR